MDSARKDAIAFLKKHQMDVEDIDFDGTVQAFLDDMKRGLDGEESSLDMIPTYIELGKDVPIGEKVIVMDAGGTNFRVATVHFDGQRNAVIENFANFPMPGVDREVGRQEFFDVIAGYVSSVVAASPNVGFCFSYAVEIFPSRDGRLIRFSKEIKAPQVKGRMIGEDLNAALAARKLAGEKHIVILNDTVATLLAGRGYRNRRFGGYIGFILGTGTNCCYVEKNSNIGKKKELDPAKSQIINTESGDFALAHQGTIDKAFDASTVNPGVHKYEKMVSGAYLGPVCGLTINKAAEGGLFSPAAAKLLKRLKQVETKDLNDFLNYPYGDNPLAKACAGSSDDVAELYVIADRIVERAAKLAATNLSAIAVKSDKGTNPAEPICIVAEGTTFYKLRTLKRRIEHYLTDYLEKRRGIYWDIINVDNATLIGSAIAGLTN